MTTETKQTFSYVKHQENEQSILLSISLKSSGAENFW